ncbi:hypothetical protein ASG76_15500 [Nocardioides sp. Soil774]|uniref:hypothetical protein n=1 Tax=Nocardioides sp. Soil774 TaxID=1736408 RepID=UPI0006F44F1E|nr:hypothetical protein [Nocardioides sp. Soil774]KRE92866.1 hypothetical protein ASG76_15500 [Nocardioides sp. Soil774]
MRLRPALAYAALACALALAGCGDRVLDEASTVGADASAAETGRSTAIPDDFPLSAGMGGPQDTIATSRTGTGLRDLALCGTSPLRGLGLRDRMVADNSGGESANTRELVLLGDAESARLVARAFADLPSACDNPAVSGGTATLTEVRESPFAPSPATTLLQTYTLDGRPGDGATVIHVVPVGAAVLVTSTYGQWARDDLADAVASTVEPLRATVAAMDAFAVDDAASSDPSSTTPTSTAPEPTGSPAAVTAVPDGFPLAVGLADDDSDTTLSAPSEDAEGMGEVEMCGQVVWPVDGTAGGTRRLVTSATGPEYFDGRELVVHADEEVAANAMAALRQAAQDCRTSGNQVWTVLDDDTDRDTVTVGLTYADGLGSSIFQVTRVGSARLMVSTYGEGSLAWLDEQAAGVTATTEKIVPAMCVFTKTGCQ